MSEFDDSESTVEQPENEVQAVHEPLGKRVSRAAKRAAKRAASYVHVDKLPTAFWTITGVFSLINSVVLLVLLILLGKNLLPLINFINQDLVGGLYTSFVAMDNAHIQTTIPINMEVPAQFDLQLDTYTDVVLSEDVYIQGAVVNLSTGGLTIQSAPTNITLPKGTNLPVHLVLTVPVDEKIPVAMDVEVDIPIKDTQLHDPFVSLQETILPYYMMLYYMPDSLKEALQPQP